MKFIKKLSQISLAAVISFVLIAVLGTARVAAVPYTGADTPPAPSPAFNIYTGVPTDGDESDFLRGKVASDTTSVNNVNSTCETGKRFMLRVYVHNGASQYENGTGNGPSVAKNTKVKVTLPGNEASSFNPSAAISASNAATVNDTMNLTCSDGKTVKLKYVAGTAEQFNQASGVQKISDSIVTTGAAIGTTGPNGDMWGCWDQRVLVRLIVEVEEVKPPVVSDAVCKLENGAFVVTDDKKRTVKGTVKVDLTNATVVSYLINWGDGSSSTRQSDEHTYAKDGKYTIQASVVVKLNDGTTKTVNGSNCATVVEFKEGKPPVVVPPTVTPPTVTTLPKTGPASVFSIFAATSIIGAVLHRMYTARKAKVIA